MSNFVFVCMGKLTITDHMMLKQYDIDHLVFSQLMVLI